MTTYLVDDREADLKTGFAATDWAVPVPFEVYQECMKDWIIHAIVRDGECIGAAYRQGHEVHVSILPRWRGVWVTKGLLRELFAGPKVTTRVAPGHDYMFGILERLGFKQTDSDLLVKENSDGY